MMTRDKAHILKFYSTRPINSAIHDEGGEKPLKECKFQEELTMDDEHLTRNNKTRCRSTMKSVHFHMSFVFLFIFSCLALNFNQSRECLSN